MHAERSFAAPRTFSDEHIEFWGGVYLEPATNRRLLSRRITFERFLRDPRVILAAIEAAVVVPIRAGLLPEQREAQKRADAAGDIAWLERIEQRFADRHQCVQRAGAVFEKLKHHAWPRRRGPRNKHIRVV